MDEQRDFFDLQVNGYGGVDFNRDDLSAEGLHQACCALEADGVAGILATIITDDLDRMSRRLANLAALRDQDPLARRIIAGVHIEGPFVNESPGYRGVHPPKAIRPADVAAMGALLDAAAGLTRIVTLAPERDGGFKVIGMLAERGVIPSAGHCDSTLDQFRGAIDAGLTMFTHLGNGCALEIDRHDNIIQRVLSLRDRLWISFIADGVHIPDFALGNYLRAAGMERSIVVSDAVAAAGAGPGRYTLAEREVVVASDRVTHVQANGQLIGSTTPMRQVATRLADRLGLSAEDVRRLTVTNPRRAIALTGQHGGQGGGQPQGVRNTPPVQRCPAG